MLGHLELVQAPILSQLASQLVAGGLPVIDGAALVVSGPTLHFLDATERLTDLAEALLLHKDGVYVAHLAGEDGRASSGRARGRLPPSPSLSVPPILAKIVLVTLHLGDMGVRGPILLSYYRMSLPNCLFVLLELPSDQVLPTHIPGIFQKPCGTLLLESSRGHHPDRHGWVRSDLIGSHRVVISLQETLSGH